MSNKNKDLYEFGNFRLNTGERILSRDGSPIRLAPKTFELLVVLIESGNRVVEKEELMREVWADAFVEEANLSVHISSLRKILANGSGENGYIETIPKRGYRFVAEVRKVAVEDEKPEPADLQTPDTLDFSTRSENASRRSTATENKIGNAENAENQNKKSGDVRLLKSGESSGVSGARQSPPAHRNTNQPKKNRLTFVVPLILVSLLCGGYVLYKFSKSRGAFEQMKIARIPDTGKTVEAAISPDGKYLAHVVREPGKQSLHVKHIVSNSAVQLVAPAAVSFSAPTFSQDGGYIYYVSRQNEQPGALFQIPVLGGEPKKILGNVAGAISFAPDGNRFAFVRNVSPDETALLTAALSGGEEKILATRRKPEHFSPSSAAWSPDGKTIIVSGGNSTGERLSNVFAVTVENGEIQPLSNRKWRAVERGAWLADNSAFVAPAMEAEGQEAFQIWEFPFSGGEPRRITNDLNDYGAASLTADGKTLATIRFEVRRNIWLVPNLETKEAKSLTDGLNDSFRFVAWSPDHKIIYPSLASGTRDIWTMNADGGNRKQLTATAHNDILPASGGEGRYIVFASNRAASGAVNIWRINAADGSNLTQLTFGADESQPSVTLDEKWVVYAANGNDGEPEKRTLWKVSIEGGEPVQLTTEPSFGADISPDGKQIVCRYKTNEGWKAAILPIEGGQPTKFLDVAPGSSLRWSADGNAITYIKTQNGVSNIWSQPLGGEAPKQLTNFTTEQILFFDWSSDNQLVCSRGVTTQEAILISDFR